MEVGVTIAAGSIIKYVYIVIADGLVFKPQLEYSSSKTDYEPYIEPQTAVVQTDGTVKGLMSLSPNMVLVTDTSEVLTNCPYYRDIGKYIDKEYK